jgi:hypothetical protein
MGFLAAIRRILGWQPIRLTKGDALAIARAHSIKEFGYELCEPIRIAEGLTCLQIQTQTDHAPGGPWYKIDGYTGEIREWGVPPL